VGLEMMNGGGGTGTGSCFGIPQAGDDERWWYWYRLVFWDTWRRRMLRTVVLVQAHFLGYLEMNKKKGKSVVMNELKVWAETIV